MRRVVCFAILLAIPLVLCTGEAANAQKAKAKKKADADMDGDKGKPKDNFVKAGSLTGKVAAVYEEKRRLRITVSYAVTVLNPGAIQQIAQAQRQLAQASFQRNPQSILSAQLNLARAKAQMYKTEAKTKDIEVQAIDDVVVRMMRPKEDFDEKGKIKKYTRKELKELKGDKSLPGYKAEWGDLQTDQIVQVTLVRKKGEPAYKRPPRRKKGKRTDDDVAVDAIGADVPNVGRVVILREPPRGK